MHTLIIGMTESGKTTLGKQLCDAYKARGRGTIVFDAAFNTWGADFQTGDPDKFFKYATRARGCMLFIDEAGKAVKWNNREAVDVATMFRHFGHSAHFLGQRPTMIAPSVRYNCGRLCLFRVSREDAADLRAEWGHDQIMQAPTLPAGSFLDVSRFKTPVIRRVF